MPSDDSLPLQDDAHYAQAWEQDRLSQGPGQLELARTQELLGRYLPPAPATILDVGGGPGRYAFWLAGEGYTIHLIDAVPLHVEQARASTEASALASAEVGDARRLEHADASADAVLLLGPLYHLTAREDRLAALCEARRVVKPGGVVAAAGISRFASTLDGMARSLFDDPAFVRIVERDLGDGQHRNPTGHPNYFTTAYFHHPLEIRGEFEDAGLVHETTLPVEGPGWLLADFDHKWRDAGRRQRILDAIRRIENEPTLLGASAHLLGIGHRGPERA